MADYEVPFVVKKVKKTQHQAHGGAWKIAYADFVTAMMAFFLLLWLISMTTPEQKKGIADYFAPPTVSKTENGAGGLFGGTAFDQQGAKMSGSPTDAKSFTAPASDKVGAMLAVRTTQGGADGAQGGTAVSEDRDKAAQDFHSAAASIRQAWQAMPDIKDVADNLLVEETNKGLNIIIMDQTGRPMFPPRSKYPFEVTRQAIAAIAPILEKLPNQITVSGHTASGTTFDDPRYGAWDLSSDRANIVRQILGEFGLEDSHIASVIGRASDDPMFPNDPYLSGNERVEISLLYSPPPVPPDLKP